MKQAGELGLTGEVFDRGEDELGVDAFVLEAGDAAGERAAVPLVEGGSSGASPGCEGLALKRGLFGVEFLFLYRLLYPFTPCVSRQRDRFLSRSRDRFGR
jgi:hypothetical protein